VGWQLANSSKNTGQPFSMRELILLRKTRSGKFKAVKKRRKMMLVRHLMKRIKAGIAKKTVYVYIKSPGVAPHMA
jgi:hypothetical protein